MNKQTVIRLLQGSLLFSVAILLSLATLQNMIAYDINLTYVKHVLSMDDTFQHPTLMSRAITNPYFHHVGYIAIIILESIACILLWLGFLNLIKNIKQPAPLFREAKQWGIIGLLFTLLIYALVFFVFGGEWFASWQSTKWNAKSASTPFIIFIGIIYLVFIQHPD